MAADGKLSACHGQLYMLIIATIFIASFVEYTED